ncbi:hypothetical protein [Paludisphaera rhizosphaerae]|uniref:hypothetical protein n=1 Tax=Paludisphaera rhizosphaerae TaxID=2711216 RepID=UPI0013ED335A|nr:hypothetical protein [Paludisphaera rhizosphaerae]
MRPGRSLSRRSLLLTAASLALAPLAGCDGGSVGDGEQASPVDPQQAAIQQKAYADFAKTKQGGKAARKP